MLLAIEIHHRFTSRQNCEEASSDVNFDVRKVVRVVLEAHENRQSGRVGTFSDQQHFLVEGIFLLQSFTQLHWLLRKGIQIVLVETADAGDAVIDRDLIEVSVVDFEAEWKRCGDSINADAGHTILVDRQSKRQVETFRDVQLVHCFGKHR